MTTIAVAPVTVAQLHAGIGAANRASVECPQDWQARATELLAEQHEAAVAEAIVARVSALQVLLSELPESSGHYARHGAENILPELFAAAASCEIDPDGRFDRGTIDSFFHEAEGLCGPTFPRPILGGDQ
jgi:hypothetical protein